jgi:hypothetical protein
VSSWKLRIDVHFPFDRFLDCVHGQHAHHMLACSVNSHCVMMLSMSAPKQEHSHKLVNLTIYSGFRIFTHHLEILSLASANHTKQKCRRAHHNG